MGESEPSWWAMEHLSPAKRLGYRALFVGVGGVAMLIVGSLLIFSIIGAVSETPTTTTVGTVNRADRPTTTLSGAEQSAELIRGSDDGYVICFASGVESQAELDAAITLMARQAAQDGESVQYAEGLALGCTERFLELGG